MRLSLTRSLFIRTIFLGKTASASRAYGVCLHIYKYISRDLRYFNDYCHRMTSDRKNRKGKKKYLKNRSLNGPKSWMSTTTSAPRWSLGFSTHGLLPLYRLMQWSVCVWSLLDRKRSRLKSTKREHCHLLRYATRVLVRIQTRAAPDHLRRDDRNSTSVSVGCSRFFFKTSSRSAPLSSVFRNRGCKNINRKRTENDNVII